MAIGQEPYEQDRGQADQPDFPVDRFSFFASCTTTTGYPVSPTLKDFIAFLGLARS